MILFFIFINQEIINAQELGEMDAKIIEKTTFINRNPQESIMVVHSVITNLQFESSMGIISVDNPDPGEFRLHLGSETNIITIKVEDYMPFKTPPIFIPKKQAKELQVTIIRKPEKSALSLADISKGDIIVESVPAGATVYLNGIRLLEKTPVVLKDQPAFTHAIRLELGGDYLPLDTSVTVIAEEEQTFRFKMPVKTTDFGNLVLSSPLAEVIKGEITGKNIQKYFELQPNDNLAFLLPKGIYRIKVNESGFIPYKKNVQVNPGFDTPFRIDLKKIRRGKALGLSMLFPGFGQFYKHQFFKGLFFIGVTAASAWWLSETYKDYNSALKNYDLAGENYVNATTLSDITRTRENLNQEEKNLNSIQEKLYQGLGTVVFSYSWNVIDAYRSNRKSKNEKGKD